MNDRPDARELLEIARNAFTAEVLPAVPETLRYTALMVANAMAIAQRELARGDAPLREEFGRLSDLLSERAVAPRTEALRAEVEGYNRRLASAIRAGRFDGESRARLFEHLRRATEEKLAVSNPKALNGPGGGRQSGTQGNRG